MSPISFGCSAFGAAFGPSNEDEALVIVKEAVQSGTTSTACLIDAGLNLIDTAPWYGKSETVLGKALKSIPRGAYYLSTKVGR